MLRYETLSKLCLFIAIVLFVASYCFGNYLSNLPVINYFEFGFAGFGFLLASGGFVAVRGKFKAGYLYASLLVGIGVLQYQAGMFAVGQGKAAGLVAAIGFFFAILQSIEIISPNKKILE